MLGPLAASQSLLTWPLGHIWLCWSPFLFSYNQVLFVLSSFTKIQLRNKNCVYLRCTTWWSITFSPWGFSSLDFPDTTPFSCKGGQLIPVCPWLSKLWHWKLHIPGIPLSQANQNHVTSLTFPVLWCLSLGSPKSQFWGKNLSTRSLFWRWPQEISARVQSNESERERRPVQDDPKTCYLTG